MEIKKLSEYKWHILGGFLGIGIACGIINLLSSSYSIFNEQFSKKSEKQKVIDTKKDDLVKIINYGNKNYSSKKIKWNGNVFYIFAHPPDIGQIPPPSDSTDHYTSNFGKEECGEEGFTLDQFRKDRNNRLEYVVKDTTNPEFNYRQCILKELIKLYNKN